MSQPQFDWSFEEAPRELPPDEPQEIAARPPARRPRWWADPRRLRLGLAVGAALLLIGALSAWVVTRLGWQRLERQIADEVRYEDEQAAAGDAALALSVWAETGDRIFIWRQLRTRLAEARLAVPLPAAHLAPVDGPPQVLSVTPLGDDLFAAEVARAYQDSAGQVLTFTLTQRYRSLGGGLWDRLPPDPAPLAATTRVQFNHISATVLVEDLPWLADGLLAADLALEQACADWGGACPPNRRLEVVFTADPQYLLTPARPGAGLAAGLGPYPAAFDLAQAAPSLSQPLYLPSLHLTGVPADDVAQAALTRALTVQGLAYLAQTIVGTNVWPADYFLEALIGRAEARLGLAEPLSYTLRAQDYVPLEGLWLAAEHGADRPADEALPLQMQALVFLNQALSEQPPEADAALLRSLHRALDFYAWMDGALGRVGAGRRAEAAWRRQVEALLQVGNGLATNSLEGLVYTCDPRSANQHTYRIRDGEAQLVPYAAEPGLPWLYQNQALSPDGRYLATVGGDVRGTGINILEVDTGWTRRLELRNGVVLVGWSAGGALVYLEQMPPPEGSFMELARAMRLNPLTGERAPLTDYGVIPNWLPGDPWLPDHSGVLLNLLFDAEPEWGPWSGTPALLAVDEPGGVRRLGEAGWGGVLSPDGRWAAFGVPERLGEQEWRQPTIVVSEVHTGVEREWLAAAEVAAVTGDAPPDYLIPLLWSPDSGSVIVLTGGFDGLTGLFSVPREGGAPRSLSYAEGSGLFFMLPVGYAADGYTLALMDTDLDNGANLVLMDVRQVPVSPTMLARDIQSAAWSPDGTLLAMAGPSGVRVVEPSTNLWRWLAVDTCSGVMWIP